VAAEPRDEQRPAQIANGVSLSLVQDFGMHGGADVCSRRAQLEEGYACFRGSGTQYHGSPIPDAGSAVSAFPQPATTRLLLGFDRVLLENFTAGLRLGYVLAGGGPRPDGAEGPTFLPFHGEARVGYTFGAAPFRRTGARWSLFVHGGIAQVDTPYRILIEEDTSKPPPASQLDNPALQTVRAYKKSGTGFVGAGASVTVAVTRALGTSVGLKVSQMFPSSGTIVSLELGCVLGF
jgi:hypothetical protein